MSALLISFMLWAYAALIFTTLVTTGAHNNPRDWIMTLVAFCAIWLSLAVLMGKIHPHDG